MAAALANAAQPMAKASKLKKHKGAKAKIKSACFAVDIGDTQLSTTLDAKWLAKPLRDALVMPAIEGFLTAKHLSSTTSVTASEVITTVSGVVVDGAASALSYAQSVSAGETVHVVLILPERVNIAVANMNMTARPSADGEASATKAFVVDIVTDANPNGGATGTGETYSMTTELNSRWLAKPVLEGLVTPAIEAYAKSKVGVGLLPSLQMVRIAVDGKTVDGTRPVHEVVPAGLGTSAQPVHVTLTLPATVAMERASTMGALVGAEPAASTMPTLTVLGRGKGRRATK